MAKLIRDLENKTMGYELVPQGDQAKGKVARKICRCPTMVPESAENSAPTAEAGDNNLGQPKEISSSKNKQGKFDDSLPTFGPLYEREQPSVLGIKKKAWQHIKKTSTNEDRGRTKEIYAVAMKRVEKEAKEAYGAIIQSTNSEFRLMMIKDGCFFLQLAFLILGKSKELGYSEKDPIFGNRQSRKDIKRWIESMFFVGNQIPRVVLKELLKEKFFQEIIAKAKWDSPPSDLCKRALYELLDLPRSKGFYLVPPAMQQPSDLLHALQNVLVGSASLDHSFGDYEAEDDFDFDLEANEEEEVENQERIFPIATGDSGGSRLRTLFQAMGLRNAIDDDRRICPCAKELKQSGIRIKKLKCGGIENIDFKSYYFFASLYLPLLPVDDGLEIIFQNLKTYEISQQVKKHNREVSSYLRFMSDIAQTPEDVNLLQKKGIIEGSSDYAEKLPRLLGRLSSEDVTLSHNFRNLRRKIRNYSSPWIRYGDILNVVMFLTLLQACFAVLAYFRPPRQ